MLPSRRAAPCLQLLQSLRNCYRPKSTTTAASHNPKPLPYSPRTTKNPPPHSSPSETPSSTQTPPPEPLSWQRKLLQSALGKWVFITLNLFIAGHLTTTYLFSIHYCVGPSMLPTINYQGDWVLVSKLHATMGWVQVGDLISFKHPVRQGYRSIKRVIGMPGDFVLRDTPTKGDGTMVRIPQGHCWVAGDNADGSRDSRMFGALPLALVRGRVLARIYPSPTLFNHALADPVDLAYS